MPRRKDTAPAQAAPPDVVAPNGIFHRDSACRVLRIKPFTLRREIATGRLRVACIGNRQVFLGQWILDWVAASEVAQKQGSGEGAGDA